MDLQEIIRSANNGDVVAMYKLFEYYHENNQHDMEEEWLYKSADNGFLRAMYVAVAYTAFSAATLMLLEAHEEALKIYLKGWNYLSLITKENEVSQEIIDDLTEKEYYYRLSVGIASCLILTRKDKAAYDFIKDHAFSDEQKVLLGITIINNDETDEDYVLNKTAIDMLKILTTNKNLKLDDCILAYAYTCLIQSYIHMPLQIVGCSSRKEATEKAYYIALEASRKDGHTGSICKDMLSHFRKKVFGGYEYIE